MKKKSIKVFLQDRECNSYQETYSHVLTDVHLLMYSIQSTEVVLHTTSILSTVRVYRK